MAETSAEKPPRIDIAEIRERADALGISRDVQNRLLAKTLRGEPLDSMTGAKPVHTEVEVKDGYEVTTRTFADGSYSIDSAEIPTPLPAGGIGIMCVTGCVNGQGAGTFPFWNCRIATDQFLFSIDFYMDGWKGSGGTFYGTIGTVYNLGYWTGAATVNSTSLVILKKYENASGPAKAQATLYVTFLGGSGSGVYKLSGYINYTSIYDTSP